MATYTRPPPTTAPPPQHLSQPIPRHHPSNPSLPSPNQRSIQAISTVPTPIPSTQTYRPSIPPAYHNPPIGCPPLNPLPLPSLLVVTSTAPIPPTSQSLKTSAQPLQPSAELESTSSDPVAESLLLVPLQSQPSATPALHADALTGTIPSLSFTFSPVPLLILMFRLYFHNGVYLHPHILSTLKRL
jgi:hypothetical protein